ncbi:MAG: hypothetical protein KME64_42285 [Scytonematopsis contorta HA4267-MV1]|jgi:hypothetical protein|nr:hypothetical protein [Scytonematopsis contorta HA4267-MV1]
MATKKSVQVPAIIDDSAMGQFKLEAYDVRVFNKAYFGLQEVWGNTIQGQNKVKWNSENWQEFREYFKTVFGTIEEPKVTLEQLVAYSKKYFDRDLEGLIEVNKASWERRDRYQARQNESKIIVANF